MHRLSEQFAAYCKSHFTFQDGESINYASLSVCLLDCIYSLRAKYFKVTLPIVDRYAAVYMNGNRFQDGDTLSDLLAHIQEQGGAAPFADNILKNHQELGGRAHIAKVDALIQLATYLKLLHIETVEDFRAFESPELLEIVIRAVKGMGDAGTNYLFMLAGDPNRCKPDVHIHHSIRDACGEDVSNEECQILFLEATDILRNDYPFLTVKDLDGTIWREYQART